MQWKCGGREGFTLKNNLAQQRVFTTKTKIGEALVRDAPGH